MPALARIEFWPFMLRSFGRAASDATAYLGLNVKTVVTAGILLGVVLALVEAVMEQLEVERKARMATERYLLEGGGGVSGGLMPSNLEARLIEGRSYRDQFLNARDDGERDTVTQAVVMWWSTPVRHSINRIDLPAYLGFTSFSTEQERLIPQLDKRLEFLERLLGKGNK
jgi:hypothetical protein